MKHSPKRSAYVVMFISEAYVSKAWPNHERRSALSRMIEGEGRVHPSRSLR